MRELIAKLVHGVISRRDFAERMAGFGFSLLTIESILDTVSLGADKKSAGEAGSRKVWRAEPFSEKTPYEQWMANEGVPIHQGYSIPNLRALEVKPWPRLGVKGALIDLQGAEGTDGAYLFELEAGASTHPLRYMFEEAIFVLEGEGETTVWQEGGQKQSLKWKKGGLFSPPLNCWRQHFNRGRTRSRLISVTDAPLVIDLFHSAGFVFNNDFVFRDRYNNEPDYFTVNQSKLRGAGSAATFGEGERGAVSILDTGFIPDINNLELYEAKSRGFKNKSLEIALSDNAMQTHISEFEVGTYKRAHRHGPGSHVMVLAGVGYTLMWTDVPKYSEAPKRVRVDWTDGSLLVPPDRWFHQHFNAGGSAAKYMATTWIGGKYFVKALGGGGRTHRLNTVSTKQGGNMVDYTDEDPVVRSMYEEELKKNGIKPQMPSVGRGERGEHH